jgi:hypothetical protein
MILLSQGSLENDDDIRKPGCQVASLPYLIIGTAQPSSKLSQNLDVLGIPFLEETYRWNDRQSL